MSRLLFPPLLSCSRRLMLLTCSACGLFALPADGAVPAMLPADETAEDTVKETAEDKGGEWHTLSIPDAWRRVPRGELQPVDGFSWYRCQVFVPAMWRQDEVRLHVEPLDDARMIFVNGTAVGVTGSLPPVYRSGLGESGRFVVQAGLLQPDAWNTIAIRVCQDDPRPNFSVAPPVLLNESRTEGMRLAGEWQYRPGDDVAWASARPPAGVAAFRDVQRVDDVDQFVALREGDSAPLSPQAALHAFEVADDLQLDLVLSEPHVTQPLFMTWDERGRLWVMEYRQYPEVAGVNMVSRDVYLRSVYDAVPQPPPFGVRGRDRISIHEDTTGDGRLDDHRTFVDGLNIATSMAIGRGGVFVTNPPYLLFYPDLDRDDVPDGDPEILLEGFGLEDSHSVINSLRFGPDGWLYGAQGSTVSAEVKRPGDRHPPVRTMGQQIWRYHPETKVFEVFAEGGGNTFGVEIDSFGNIFSGHNGGDTRGFHYVQGGYSRKGFGKHGPLSNPYAFGYFSSMKHHQVARFTHNFVIYEDRQLPAACQGRLFGIEPLQGQIVLSDVRADGSSFQTSDITRVVTTPDPWFRPVDIKTGPDGAIYIADLYEQRIDHSSHYAGRIDRSSGRIYRLRSADRQDDLTHPAEDLSQQSPARLVELLKRGTRTQRQTALRVLGDRRDLSLAAKLLTEVQSAQGQDARECLWALHQSGGLTERVAMELLSHPDQFVRGWVIQLQANDGRVSPAMATALHQLAASESYVFVRRQLAASARRLPATQSIPILQQLLQHEEDATDVHQPLMLWWGIEHHLGDHIGRQLVRDLIVADAGAGTQRLFEEHIAERLMRRYVQSGTRPELLAAASVMRSAQSENVRRALVGGFEKALQGRSLSGVPESLVEAVVASGLASTVLRMRTGDQAAFQQAVRQLRQGAGPVEQRELTLETLGELATADAQRELLAMLDAREPRLVTAAISALRHFNDDHTAREIVQRFSHWPADTQIVAETILSSRRNWTAILLEAAAARAVDHGQLSMATVRRMGLHDSPEITAAIARLWGEVSGATTGQMKQDIDRVQQVLAEGSGNPKTGKQLYLQNCGRCHRLFDEGGQVGPDLTSFQRTDLSRMLPNIINPSLEIREGFENHLVVTVDGRVFNGFLIDQDGSVVILRSVDGTNLTLPRSQIDELQVSPVSLMPEGTLRLLKPQQLRDLFAYLRSSQPVNY